MEGCIDIERVPEHVPGRQGEATSWPARHPGPRHGRSPGLGLAAGRLRRPILVYTPADLSPVKCIYCTDSKRQLYRAGLLEAAVSRREELRSPERDISSIVDYSAFEIGTLISNVAPRSLFGEADSVPPWAAMMDLAMASPMPIPSGLVVKKASKIFGIVSGAIPLPESRTSIWTASVCADEIASMRTSRGRSSTAATASNALKTRFMIAC